MPGGQYVERKVDDEAKAVYEAVAAEVNKKLGRGEGDRGNVTKSETQVVAGKNYRLSVEFGDGKAHTVTVFRSLDKTHELKSVE